MRNIIKILLVSIGSFSLMFSANSGELTVNGTAKATYNATSGDNSGNAIGITNELNFTAAGEMDNGFTWSYSMELDPSTTGSGQANNDDTQITLGMNDLGTLKFCVSECSNSKKYKWDNSAYTTITDTSLSSGIVYPINEMSYASGQYHTPELPFSTTASISYGVPKADGQSGNTTGQLTGDSASFVSITSVPTDGLTVTASGYQSEPKNDGIVGQAENSGLSAALNYAYGNFKAGIGMSHQMPASVVATVGGAATIEEYENRGASIAYAVNDDLSLSISREESEAISRESSTDNTDVQVDSYQVAYSMGGATLSLARSHYDNIGYVLNKDAEETIIALAFAF
jgi:hypothetical protein